MALYWRENEMSNGDASRFEPTVEWRKPLSMALLFSASLPFQVYAIEGFEFTLSLLLAPLALALCSFKNRVHIAVLAFVAFCFLLALLPVGDESSVPRNLLGAMSYSSAALYVLAGMTLAKHVASLSDFWKITGLVAVGTSLLLLVDFSINGGNLVLTGPYASSSYSADETTYIKSIAPFYGRFGVITFSTVAMTIGAFALASAQSFPKHWQLPVVIVSNALIIAAALMSSRQVTLGILIFYVALGGFALSRRIFLKLLAFAVVVFVAVVIFSLVATHFQVFRESGEYSSYEIFIYKVAASFYDLANGRFDELMTGRLRLWQHGFSEITPRVALIGCGFCSLSNTFGFEFSTLHNVVLTAVFKGGVIYALLYIGSTLVASIYLLSSARKTAARNVTLAALVSLAVQSLVNDVLFFQVVPQLLFALTGFLMASRKNHEFRPSRGD